MCSNLNMQAIIMFAVIRHSSNSGGVPLEYFNKEAASAVTYPCRW